LRPLLIKLNPDAANSVAAPNRVGKTSVFEAIHFAIFGTVPRLRKLQAAERPDAYIVNCFHPSGHAVVGLTFDPDDGSSKVQITVERTRAGARTVSSSSGHADPEGFLKSLREDFVLVDYAKFAKFIDTSALERGRSFASLVGLSSYSGLRQALEGAADTRSLNSDFDIRKIEAEIAAHEREVADASTRSLRAYTEITGEMAADLTEVEALCAVVSRALQGVQILKSVVDTKDIRQVDLTAAERVIEKEEGGTARRRQAELQQSLGDLEKLAPARAEGAERAALIAAATDRDTALAKVGSPLLRELYEKAKLVVRDARWVDPKRCPVCESTLSNSLGEHLERRIAQYAAADTANEVLEKAVLSAAGLARFEKLETAGVLGVPAGERKYAAIIQAAHNHSFIRCRGIKLRSGSTVWRDRFASWNSFFCGHCCGHLYNNSWPRQLAVSNGRI
jgi:DNA repair exonuclease SbcCD ATPase subunit